MANPIPIVLAAAMLSAESPPNRLAISVEGVRNAHGLVHACLTRNPKYFPDCRKDPAALKHSGPAGETEFVLSGFAPGDYALTVVHDENANHRFDTMLGIPKEGFGFSRNPVVRFGAPRFGQVNMKLGLGFTRTTVRIQYLL